MLESLERAHLFLVPLDEERRWYRWHTLFREVLLARLQATRPEQVVRLNREAARWYQHQGWLHEAIPHALATQDFWFVAELLENCTERLFLQGEVKTLLAWIKRLPGEVLRGHPRLATSYMLAFNIVYPFSHQQLEEWEYLQQLRAGVEQALQSEGQGVLLEAERDRLRHRLTVLDGWELVARALSDGNVEQLNSLAEQAQQLKLDDDTIWEQHRLAPFSMAWRMAGNFPPMVAALQEGRKLTRVTHQRYLEVQTLWGLIAALIALGQLQQAHDLCHELQELVKRLGGPLPVAAYPDFFQAQLAYEWNQLETAKVAAEIAIEKSVPMQYLDTLMGASGVLFHVCLARRELEGAEQVVREVERVYQSTEIPLFRPWVESFRVQLWLARGDASKAADWAEHTPYREALPSYSCESVYLALVRVYLAQQRYPDALHLLTTLLSSAEQVARVGSMLSILALQVAALQASGATQEALRVLLRLLSLAESEGYLRVFLDAGEPVQQALQALLDTEHMQKHDDAPALVSYARALLEAFANEQRRDVTSETISSVSKALPHSSSQAAQQLLEPLTPREQEVLRLLAEGTSNQEISRQLVVSLATAKKHVASILSKLGAENRTQAIARARSLSLL
jgi:LuxR family maltose regulon positive regulatory protein